MMKEKTLSDYPAFVKISGALQKLQSEKAEVLARIDQINVALSQPNQPQTDGVTAWDLALQGKTGEDVVDNRQGLHDEQLELEGRLHFIDEALEVGMMELDRVRGQASLELCQQVREKWVTQIARILDALKVIDQANQALDVIRSDLERNGIRTGSLASAAFDPGGRWSDPCGGRVTGYQRFISENYPELTAAAGMEIKSKLQALNERERRFERRFEEGTVE
jgi:hypothetical protein